jgi:hypothetical protein
MAAALCLGASGCQKYDEVMYGKQPPRATLTLARDTPVYRELDWVGHQVVDTLPKDSTVVVDCYYNGVLGDDMMGIDTPLKGYVRASFTVFEHDGTTHTATPFKESYSALSDQLHPCVLGGIRSGRTP